MGINLLEVSYYGVERYLKLNSVCLGKIILNLWRQSLRPDFLFT
jgi:hypothetical protein